jgi:heptosyltransferase-2
MRNILVIRFGSLGDLCILGWALSRLADSPAGADVRLTLATKAGFAPLMEQVRGIDRVVRLEGRGLGAVAGLANTLRRESWDQVLDAHNIMRGHLLLGLMGRRPDRRLDKDTAARLFFLTAGRSHERLGRSMLDRFEELTGIAAGTGTDVPPAGPPPLSALRPDVAPGDAPLAFAPGAQWDTKRWPAENFAALLTHQLAADKRAVKLVLGPREAAWYDGSPLASAAAAAPTRVEVIRGRSLVEVARLLAQCRLLVTNDSGLLHVAEAVGTPVLAFFGPTVKEFGYFPLLPASGVLEIPLDCRPCSRNGKRPCHRQDLACLVGIPVVEAHRRLRHALETSP